MSDDKYREMTLDIAAEVKFLNREIEMITKQIHCPDCGKMVAAVEKMGAKTSSRRFVVRCKDCGDDVIYNF